MCLSLNMHHSGYNNPRNCSPNFQSFGHVQGSSRATWNPNNPPNARPNFRQRHPNMKSKFNNRNVQRFNNPHQKVTQEFWCETCDRGFRSLDILNTHKSEHQICGIDGCKFIAHPKVVTNHIQMQHSTGLYNKIRNVESPDDIAKWIAERKKKFPSRENIEKAKQQLTEANERGEKIRENKSRFNNRNKKENDFKRRTNKFQRNKVKNNTFKIIKIESVVNDDVYCGLRAFRGTSELTRLDIVNNVPSPEPHENNIDIEDDEWQPVNSKSSEIVTSCTGLNFLIGAYLSTDEEKCNDISEKVPVENISPVDNIAPVSIEKVIESDDSGPEEVSNQKQDVIPNITCDVNQKTSENSNNKRFRRRKRHLGNVDEESSVKIDGPENKKINKHPATTFERQLQYYKDRPSTLLEKLLEKEIRHERNVILQCINYIVTNNFFDGKN